MVPSLKFECDLWPVDPKIKRGLSLGHSQHMYEHFMSKGNWV